MGKGLSAYNTTTWMGAALGFSLTGYGIENIGMESTFTAIALLSLAAIALLVPLRQNTLPKAALASH